MKTAKTKQSTESLNATHVDTSGLASGNQKKEKKMIKLNLKELLSRISNNLRCNNLLDGKLIPCNICHLKIERDVLTLTSNFDPYYLSHTHFHPKCYIEKNVQDFLTSIELHPNNPQGDFNNEKEHS